MSLFKLQLQSNPFRFLLYAEWFLLAVCGSLAGWEAIQTQDLPLAHLMILGTLWGLGLMVPMSSDFIIKLLYTGLEIGVIFTGTTLGYLHILPMLYLIVVIRSCLLFNPPGRWIVAGLTLSLFLFHQIQSITRLAYFQWQEHFWMHLSTEILMFGFSLFLLLKLATSLLEERKTQAQLLDSHQQLRTYTQKAEDLAAAQERNRIACEIHDSLGHVLTALIVQLQTAYKYGDVNPEQAQEFLRQALSLSETAIDEVRRSVSALRGDESLDFDIGSKILNLTKDFRQRTNIEIIAQVHPNLVLPEAIARSLYRIAQEALTNIYKHAHAKTVRLILEIIPASETIVLSIEDDGQGFCLTEPSTGFGLCSMRSRAAAINGRIQIQTDLGAGCHISVRVPLNQESNLDANHSSLACR